MFLCVAETIVGSLLCRCVVVLVLFSVNLVPRVYLESSSLTAHAGLTRRCFPTAGQGERRRWVRGWFSVFQSFVLRHLVISPTHNTKYSLETSCSLLV